MKEHVCLLFCTTPTKLILMVIGCTWSQICSSPPDQSWPQSATTTGLAVFPDCEPTASIFFTTSIPSTTVPKTQCLPSSHAVFTVHRKNWEPFVFGPAFAMER